MFTTTATSSINHADIQFGKELGRGGFGVVYQGIWRHNDVAIKQLLIDKVSPESALEFQTESQVMAGLRSPNIVQFYGFCMSPHYWIVMEYMPNGSLFSVLHSEKPIEWTLRFNIALDVAKGLSFLHHENILHRDIKSLNVLLDKHYQAKLTDFGLSKVKAETKSNTIASKTSKDSVGTIAWMAPELFRRKGVYVPKSDVYSLGVTYWEMASRKIPFADAIDPQIIPTWVEKGDREDIPTDCPETFGKLIEQCWAGDIDNRPTADNIVERLKILTSTFVDAATSITSTTTSTTTLSSGPVYKNNLDSTLPLFPQENLNQAFPKPIVFSIQPTSSVSRPLDWHNIDDTNPFENIGLNISHFKPALKVDVKDLTTFLKLVAEGEQDQAEALLQKNKDIALLPSDLTDLSNRTFKNITGFQYAVWALDWHMWTIIRKYLSDEEAAKQIKTMETGTWVTQHGKSASWQNLLDALQKQIDLCKQKKWDEAETQWQKQVGGAQGLLPAHVVNEYCHPTRPFEPCPNFTQSGLLRSRKTDQGEWFTTTYNGGKLGEKFACCRSSFRVATGWRGAGESGWREMWVTRDHKACHELLVTRAQQRNQLFAELLRSASVISPKVDAQPLTTFLKLVAEGEQDQAEAMIQNNKDLALSSGDVTDLSNRTFKNITGFQYAIWALDWHMWTMIRKSLPDEEAREQIKAMETGAWVTQHGKSASWQNLLDVLQKYIDICHHKKYNEAEILWNKEVGGAQRFLPAHVVNEYCHPTRSFEPCPDFNKPGLPRSRNADIGDWFAITHNNGKLGETFACFRYSYNCARPRSGDGVGVVGFAQQMPAEYKACHALLVTRTQQRDQLLAELTQKAKPAAMKMLFAELIQKAKPAAMKM